ncbi:MAG: hypothetical protein ACYC40_01655 [Patescibacteria group bacterium]
MKKSIVGPLLTIIVLVIVAAMFVYFFIQLNRLDKKLIAQQTAISTDSAKISAIVNFFNANTNAANTKK